MKKGTSVLLAVFITVSSFAQSKTVYLNSKTVNCNIKGLKKACLQYKTNPNDSVWQVYPGKIQGFTYNPGYFYTLQIRPVKTGSQDWKLLKVVTRMKSTVQQQNDSSFLLSQPPAALVGQWNFTQLFTDAGAMNFSPEREYLRFDTVAMRVNGKASCNGFFGNYTADSTGQIHFEAIGHTMMACPALEKENRLLKAMERVDNWKIEGDNLYLNAGSRKLLQLRRTLVGGKA